MTQLDSRGNLDKKETTVIVTVNAAPVGLPDSSTTGIVIKESAIAQGASITASFVLFLVKGHGREMVGDHDTVKVNKNSVFVAVADDDNS